MKIKVLSLISLIVCLVFLFPYCTKAGFGISPPRVWNDYLVPGSHFEQTITLTRSNPDNPIKIITEIDAPDIKDWITINQGKEFIYPAGPQQFPITIVINVPEDAGYSTYYGKMTIKTAPIEETGQVTVALGAVIDFKIRVSGEQFSDFKTRGISIPDLEEEWPLKFVVILENLGNVKTRPSKVHLEIFDDYHQTRLKSGDITNLTWVDSFKTGNSEGQMAISLASGQYWAEYEVYKDEQMILKDKIRFYVYPPGTLIPPPFLTRLINFLTATPLRLVLSTFLGTLILITIIIIGIKYWKIFRKRKNKKKSKRVKPLKKTG